MTPTDTDRRLAEIAAYLNRRAQPGPASLSETVTYYSVQCTLLRDHVAFLLGLVEQQGREILRLQRPPLAGVLLEIAAERERQERKWGQQNHPWHVPGLSIESVRHELRIPSSTEARDYVQALADYGILSYSTILLEEVCEAVDESDETIARRELVQVAAVAVAAVEAIDRRRPPARLADDERHLADIIRRPKPAPDEAPDFRPGDRVVYYPSGRENPGHYGTVRTAPRRLGEEGPWVVNLHQMAATYKRGECSIVAVAAAACSALALADRPSLPSSPPPPAAPAGSAPASLSCTPTGSEGGHGQRVCPDCAGRAAAAGVCLTCAGTGFVGVP